MQEERLDYISKSIQSGRFISLREISDTFSVNMQTARRDVVRLAERGLLVKVHGGAMPLTGPDSLSLDERIHLRDTEKDAIARAAAEFTKDGDIIIMDAGSTTSYMLPYLKEKKLQIITNSISLLTSLNDSWPGIDVIASGGYYYPKSKLLLGPMAVNSIESIHADEAFISAAGVSASGVFNSNMLVVELERAMIAQSAQTFLLADSSKFGRNSLVRLCGFEDISAIITVGSVQPEIASAIEQAGSRLVTAEI